MADAKLEAKVSSRSMEAAMVARLFKDALESDDPIVSHFVWERDDGQKLDMGRPKAHPSFPNSQSACRRIDERIGQWVSGEKPGVDRNAVARLEVAGGPIFDFSMESFEKAALADDGSLVVGVGQSKTGGREPMELGRVARLRLYASDGSLVGRKRALVPIKEIIQIKKRESEAQAKRLESNEKNLDSSDAGHELAMEEDRQWADQSREPDAGSAGKAVAQKGSIDPAAMAMDAALLAVGRNMGELVRKAPLPVGEAKAPSEKAHSIDVAGQEAKAMKEMRERVEKAEFEAMEQARSKAAKVESEAFARMDAQASEELKASRARMEMRIAAQERSLIDEIKALEARRASLLSEIQVSESKAGESSLESEARFQERLAQELSLRDAAHAQAAMEIGESFEERLGSERERMQEESQQALRQALAESKSGEEVQARLRSERERVQEESQQALRQALAESKSGEEVQARLRSEHAKELALAVEAARKEALCEVEPSAKALAAKMWVESQVRLERAGPPIAVEFVKKVFPPLPLGCDEILLTLDKAELSRALEALAEHGDYEARIAAKGDAHLSMGVSVSAGKAALLSEFIASFSRGGVMIRKSGPKPV